VWRRQVEASESGGESERKCVKKKARARERERKGEVERRNLVASP